MSLKIPLFEGPFRKDYNVYKFPQKVVPLYPDLQVHMDGDSLVPVLAGVLVQGGQDDVEQSPTVVAHQAHDVVIAPVVECTLSYLQKRENSL